MCAYAGKTTQHPQCKLVHLFDKQTFNLFFFFSQDDKDLVHEFVNSDGLNALISVGQDADQNYQNYILRGTVFH